jgi:hypothetical protein
MKKLIYGAAVLLALSGLTSCESSYNYYVAGLNKTNMSGYRSFAWMPMSNSNQQGGSQMADVTIKDAATQALTAKGLTLRQRNPDLLVSYSTKVGTGTRTYYYPNYGYDPFWGPGFGFGFGWGGAWGRWGYYRPYYYYGAPFVYGGGVDTEHYKEGTIIIDLIDVRTKRVVWRGFGVGELHHNPQKDIEALPKAVQGILSQLNLNVPRGMMNNNGYQQRVPARRTSYPTSSSSI